MRLICSLCLSLLTAAGADFRVVDTKQIVHTETEWTGAKAILLFFVELDCPVGNSYVPEMNRIATEYAGREVKTYAVHSDNTDTDAAVAKYASDYEYTFPLLLDHKQQLVELADASVTPEAVVLTPRGEVLYRGRIDNRVEDFGKQRPAATEHDLRDALDQVLAGKPVAHPKTKSVGCAITRLKGNS